MTSVTIKNSNNGDLAQVVSGNLLTSSNVVTRMRHISNTTQQAFILSTNFITETTAATEFGILYVLNPSTNDKKLFIERIRVCVKLTTPATGIAAQFRIVTNPTTGTLITDENPADINNANLSSGVAFTGTAYKPTTAGETVTNGTHFDNFTIHAPGHTAQDYNGALELGPGKSIAILYKLQAAGDVCCSVQCYFEKI